MFDKHQKDFIKKVLENKPSSIPKSSAEIAAASLMRKAKLHRIMCLKETNEPMSRIQRQVHNENKKGLEFKIRALCISLALEPEIYDDPRGFTVSVKLNGLKYGVPNG